MKKISKIVSAFVCLAMAVGVGVAIGSTGRDAEGVKALDGYESVYLLDGTNQQTNADADNRAQSYTASQTVDQDDGVTWEVYGNTTLNPWRIGGKASSSSTTATLRVQRAIYSNEAISDNIAAVTVESGTSGVNTLHGLTISVHSSASDAANGTNEIASITESTAANIISKKVTLEKTGETSWAGKYYRIVYDITVKGKSNTYIQFKSAEFFVTSEKTDTSVSITNAEPFVLVAGASSTALNTTTNPSGLSLSYSSSNENAATVDGSGNVTPLAKGVTKITASYAGSETQKASSATIDAHILKQTSAIPNSGTITMTATDLDKIGTGSAYADYNGFHYSSVTDSQAEMVWNSNNSMPSSGEIQMQAGSGKIYNYTSLGTIVSITITKSQGDYEIKYGPTIGDVTHNDTNDGYGFFSITSTGSNALKISSIVIAFGSIPAPTTLSLATKSMSLETGETAGSALTFTTDSPSATFGWATENSSYATVANGVVTAGSTSDVTVKIYVWFDTDGSGTFDPEEDLNDYCEVTVTAPVVKRTVSFNGNTAAGSMESVEVNDGTSYTLPANEFTVPSGKRFAGWKANDAGDTLAAGASYTVNADVEFYAQWEDIPTATYKKVKTNLYNFSGDYLIVYEDGEVAFDGSLSTLDGVGDNTEVTIANEKIALSESYEFNIASITGGYSIQSASGKYIGNTSDSNNMAESTSIVYTNSISYDNTNDDMNIVSSSSFLRFNSASNQNRFRYYKSSSYTGQKEVALYMQVDKAEEFALELLNLTYGTCSTWTEGHDKQSSDFTTAWTTLSNLYDTFKTDTAMVNKLVGTTADEHGTMIQEAMARYDLLVNKYHLTNIITSRNTSGAYHAFNIFGSDSSTAISLIVIISVVSITAVGAFYFVRRRKEN